MSWATVFQSPHANAQGLGHLLTIKVQKLGEENPKFHCVGWGLLHLALGQCSLCGQGKR